MASVASIFAQSVRMSAIRSTRCLSKIRSFQTRRLPSFSLRCYSTAATPPKEPSPVLFISHSAMCEHLRDMTKHPDQPERLERILESVGQLPTEIPLVWREAQLAEVSEVEAVHEKARVDTYLKNKGEFWIGYNMVTTAHSCDAAFLAAGAALQAVNMVNVPDPQLSEIGVVVGSTLSTRPLPRKAFAAVRPAGSHARRHTYAQSCLLNNVAIAATNALNLKICDRIAIVDFDVHHGNGTQEIFYERADVLYCSLHRFEDWFYPMTGAASEVGEGKGEGYTVNVGLPEKSTDADYLASVQQVIAPILRQYKPDMILVSAGYDAHQGDSKGGMCVTDEGYSMLSSYLSQLADELCEGRVVFVLEGGDDPAILAKVVPDCLQVLAGTRPPYDVRTRVTPREPVAKVLQQLKAVQGKYWKL